MEKENAMKFIVTKDYGELSQVMAQLMLKHMHTEKERTNIAITTGSTCIQGYRLLAKQVHGRSWFDTISLMNFGSRMSIMRKRFLFVKSVSMRNTSMPQVLHRTISIIWIWKIIKPLIVIYRSREA